MESTHTRTQKRQAREHQTAQSSHLEDDYILNLQKQTATLETQIKLLKDREVDQKNKASGYETLLRDGIPLNEHFLALKNKYNNERDAMESVKEKLSQEIQIGTEMNEQRRHQIEALKRECNELQRKQQDLKDRTTKKMIE